MAAFSYQDPPFPIDSVFMANSATKSSVFGNECFPNWSQFCPSFGPQKQELCEPMFPQAGSTSINGSGLESSCLEQQSVSNEPSVAEKQSFASMADNKTESGEQVSQNLAPLDKKRKSRNGSFSNSANSKVKCKKQQKKGQKEALKESEKNNKKDQNQGTEEPPKLGYIHVRARRGEATDSHSLAERVRREKISERMKMLQALVPGCDKVTGKALMLDEIINYVQSLQTHVEFLSMKLASLDPMVYTFGLMDLHPTAFGTEEMNNDMGLQIPLMQPTSSSGSTAVSDSAATNGATTTATATIGAAFPSPLVDSSATMLQQDQKPITLQDGRSLYWGMDEQQQQQQQRQSIIDQFCFGANNNLYSFH